MVLSGATYTWGRGRVNSMSGRADTPLPPGGPNSAPVRCFSAKAVLEGVSLFL